MSARVRFTLAAAVVVAAIATLVFVSISSSSAYYLSPAELAGGEAGENQRVRVAGRVVEGTIDRAGTLTEFDVSDGRSSITVATHAVLPDTFGPGVEVVAEGAMVGEHFSASTVLAKCPSKFKARQAAGTN